MRKCCAFHVLVLLSTTGCGESHPAASPIIVSQQTVTVSGDSPYVDMADGTRIGVDGVPAGQAEQFTITQYRDSDGKLFVDVDTASEPFPEPGRP